MKIAVVRGAFLNPFECQLYAPLGRRHDVSLAGADWQFYREPITYPDVKTIHASLWGASLSKLHRMAPAWGNRLLSWTLGRSYGFYDLDERTQGAEILHSAETFFTMTHQCVALKRKRRCALVVTVSENLPHMGESHPSRRRLKAEAIQEADHFVAITETTRRMLIEEGISAERITVIPWSLDLNRFRPAPKDRELLSNLMIDPDDFVILFIGRMIPEKGIRDILHVISSGNERFQKKRVRFLFVGEGPLLEEIQESKRRFPDLIRVHPFVTYDRLPALHNLADVFLLPSIRGHKIAEQFGFVLIESMACGKPVITTSVGSIPDVVGDAAYLVLPGHPQELAAAIHNLVESNKQREAMAEKSLARACEHFDAEKNAARLENVYRQALSRAT